MRPSVPRYVFDTEFDLDGTQMEVINVLTCEDQLGVYLWGPVGRGKTWLLDRYFSGLQSRDNPSETAKRVHFHSFFRDLHASYFRQGFSIDRALEELLGGIDVLCFDEFHVHDIGDATLIARMLDALFARRVALIVTSNYPPDGLLPNPLFHEKFVPTIAALKRHLRVMHVDGTIDYRTRGGSTSRFSTGTWSTRRPGGQMARSSSSRHLVDPSAGGSMSFDELCGTPQSTGDYLAMIERQESMAITDIPALKGAHADAVKRFCNLVDVLYDRDIRTQFHSTSSLGSLGDDCTGLDLARILSRLTELNSSQ